MNLRETLLAEHSKANCNRIVDWIGHNQQRFNQLFELFLSEETPLAQRAFWPMSYAVNANPGFMKSHFNQLLKKLAKKNIHDAVKRNAVRLLQDIQIPEAYQGKIMDLCFNYISSPIEKPAIKVFSLTVLVKFAIQYPDIKTELKTIIETRWEFESAAFKARARKIIKNL